MIPLYTKEEFIKAKSDDKLACKCYICDSSFLKSKKTISVLLKGIMTSGRVMKYCSKRCEGISRRKYDTMSKTIQCGQCEKQFTKNTRHVAKTKNHFCSRSCAATYNNTHKKHGTRRSKLEVWLEQQLPSLYPSLEFHFNRKDAINAELDIYIPSLKLAFELNGLFHYEPIFGPEKLAQIQNNDQRKYQACIEKNIELCLIDVSSFIKFKPLKAVKYLIGIREIIDRKISF